MPTDSFLRNALDYLFQDYPHLQTIQEDVYSIIKLFLSETKHPDVNQFQDISLHVDSVSGDIAPTNTPLSDIPHKDDSPDILDSDKPLDLTYTHNDDTFYTMDSHELADKLNKVQSTYHTSSCPSLDKGLNYKPQLPPYPTEGMSPKIEIVTDDKECIHTKSGDTNVPKNTKILPRVSTPIEATCTNPLSERLRGIIFYNPALHIPPVDLTVALGQVQNIQKANQRLAAMAQNHGRGHNAGLQGADIALIQIRQRMEDRDNNRDLSHKKLLMFLKDMFNGSTKGHTKSHWLEFKKYLDYQQQQGFVDLTNRNSFGEIKQMFRMTLNDNALVWCDWYWYDAVTNYYLVGKLSTSLNLSSYLVSSGSKSLSISGGDSSCSWVLVHAQGLIVKEEFKSVMLGGGWRCGELLVSSCTFAVIQRIHKSVPPQKHQHWKNTNTQLQYSLYCYS